VPLLASEGPAFVEALLWLYRYTALYTLIISVYIIKHRPERVDVEMWSHWHPCGPCTYTDDRSHLSCVVPSETLSVW
jgi:hypothetical protein